MKCIVIQHRYYNRYIVWQLYLWPSTFLPYNLMKLIMYFVTWSIRFIKSETPMNNFNTQDTEIKLTSIFCVFYIVPQYWLFMLGKKCYFMFPEIHAINFNSYWCYLLEIAKLHWCWLSGLHAILHLLYWCYLLKIAYLLLCHIELRFGCWKQKMLFNRVLCFRKFVLLILIVTGAIYWR